MLDSKLIKKYSKLGLWSKILLVAFFTVMVIGAIVGYFLHNNIYAQQPSGADKVTVSLKSKDDTKGLNNYVTKVSYITVDESGNETSKDTVNVKNKETYSFEIPSGDNLYIAFEPKNNKDEIECFIDGTHNEGAYRNNGDQKEYYQCYIEKVQGNKTVSVDVVNFDEVTAKLGTINGKETGLPLGQFVSEIDVQRFSWSVFDWGWRSIGSTSLNDIKQDSVKIKVATPIAVEKPRKNRIYITTRENSHFTVKSITAVYTNPEETSEFSQKDGYATVNIGNTKPNEIRINLEGEGYTEKKYSFVNTNEDTNSDSKVEVIKSESRVFSGYDMVKDEDTWKGINGNYVVIVLDEEYTVLKNSLGECKSSDGSQIETALLEGSEQRFIMNLKSEPDKEGTVSLYVVKKDTIFDIDFTTGTGTSFDLDAGINSITVGGREADSKGDENGHIYFSTNSSYVENSLSSSAVKVKINFKPGYTLYTLDDNIDNIMNLVATSDKETEPTKDFSVDKETEPTKDFSVTLSDVEEAEESQNNYACTFDLLITKNTGGNKDVKLSKITSELNLVFREYTIKFVRCDENGNGKSYDSSVFSISKNTTSSSGGSTGGSSEGSSEKVDDSSKTGVDDSYRTEKDYIRVSASASDNKVYFDINLGENYIDCKNNLEFEPGGENDNIEIGTEEGKGTKDEKLYFKIGSSTPDQATIKIKGIEPNKIYVPELINQDEILEKYNMGVSATLCGAKGEAKEINSQNYYCYDAVYEGTGNEGTGNEGTDYQLRYKLLGNEKFKTWAQSQYVSTLFTNQFFDSNAKVKKGSDGNTYVEIKNLDSSKTKMVTLDNKGVRVVNSQIKGPDLEKVKVNFTLDTRYKEFLNFIKTLKNKDGTWTTGDSVEWESSSADQIVARATIEYHILSEDSMDEFFGLEALGSFDLRNSVADMIVQADESNPEKGVSVSTEIDESKIDAFPEEKYKLIGLNFTGTQLYENYRNEISSYNFRILNIAYPTHVMQINTKNNMATFEIISGFLTDTWETKDADEGNQRLQATYNYNSNIAFTIQAGSGYTISEVEKEIEMYTSESDREKGENKVSYKYTEYQNEKNETVLGITLDNVKSDLYIYVDLGPSHKTITHSKIEGANSYRIEKNDQGEYRCKEMILGRNTVPEGNSYYFMIEAQTGYNIDTLEVSSSDSGKLSEMSPQPTILYDQGNERSSKIKVYELKSVQKNQVISGTIVKEKCSVTFNLDKDYPEALSYKYEGQTLSGSKKVDVDYGENIEFSTQVEEKYNRSNYKIMLFEKGSEENGRELNLVNGVYTISNIVTDKDVRIEGIEINRYSINLVKNDAAEYLNSSQNEIFGVQTVEYNGDYEFTLKANAGYAIGDSTQVICTSEDGTKKTLTPDKSGKYKLSNVKKDFTITIMNVDDIYYTVTLVPVEGVTYVNDKDATVNGSFKIKHGSNFEFGVNVDDAYDDSKAGMYIVINDGTSQNLRSQILYSGRYTINNITEDAEIKVGNIRKNTYTVTLNKVEGMDFYNDSNKVISGDNTVSHGDSLSFKVGLYPAYSDSKVKIMLGTQELSADESGFYTVKNVIENKIVTVNGVEETAESKFINTINNLPDDVSSLSDVDDVISASRTYENFSDEQKAKIGNIDKLKRLQEQVKKFHHVSNGITIEGVDWNIKLFAIPIDNSMEVYTRLYQKLNSEYILSLYNVYLWDTIKDEKYTLPEGQSVVVSLPTPEMTYFEKPTGIHEKDNGKLDYLSLILGSEQLSFTTDSFSPMGIVANRTSTPGRSSLLDTWDANVQAIKDYALSNTNSSGSRNESSASSSEYISDNDSSEDDSNTGNISEKFKSRNNPVTPRGSAIRLLLVLLILILLSIIIIIIIENMKKNKAAKK